MERNCSRHTIIQDKHASLTQPDHCHFTDLRSERLFTSVYGTCSLSRSDGREKGVWKVIVEIDRCLIDADDDYCVQKLWILAHGQPRGPRNESLEALPR